MRCAVVVSCFSKTSESLKFRIVSDVVAVVVVFAGEDKQDAVWAEVVHGSPDFRVLKQACFRAVEVIGCFL